MERAAKQHKTECYQEIAKLFDVSFLKAASDAVVIEELRKIIASFSLAAVQTWRDKPPKLPKDVRKTHDEP